MRQLLSIVALGTPLAIGCAAEDEGARVDTRGLAIAVLEAHTTCAEQGLGTHQFRIEEPVSGTYQIDAGNSLLFQYYDETNTVFFYTNSSLRMNGVIVDSGARSTVWELPGANGWPSLGAIDPETGTYAETDAVTFCFDYELYLNPNGYAHYGRRWGWDIAKTGYAPPVTLAAGSSFLAPYAVTVTSTGSTPEGLWIEGPVFLNNPTPYTPTIDAVTVMVGDLPATVTCPFALPHVLPAFTTATCDFTVDVPDTSDRLIYVDVVADGLVGVDRSLETASFSDHTTSYGDLDECVAVYDDHVAGQFLGTACATDGAKTFTYTAEIGPFEACGPFEVTNTAWFEGLDSGASETASYLVDGAVPCQDGCSLTPGYWKTHSEHGPARYDDTWAQLPAGADTAFFLSGQSYYRVLWTSNTAGNAYYTLARAYIAAQLNQLNGASFDAVGAAFAEATTLLETHAPSSIALSKKGAVRTRWLELATILDDYNNGLIGPGHCTE